MTAQNSIISDKRQIAAIFREVVFHDLELRHKNIRIKILEVEESNRRSDTDKRLLRASGTLDNASQGQQLTFICQFPEFVVTFESKVLSVSEPLLLSIPEQLTITNGRAQLRVNSGSMGENPHPCLVSSSGKHFVGNLKLIEMSSGGFSAELEIAHPLSVVPGAHVLTTIRESRFSLSLTGRIISTTLRSDKNSTRTYLVNAVRPITSRTDTIAQSPIKRAEPRFPAALSLAFRSPSNLSLIFDLDITNVSISGFSGRLRNPLFSDLTQPGFLIQETESQLVARVISNSSSSLHCQWVHGNKKARLNWLRTISPHLSNSVQTDTFSANKVLSVFLESGALGTTYLNAHRAVSQLFSNGLRDQKSTSSYVHRWINVDDGGHPKGYISSIRLSDNTWIIGDLVGSVSEQRRISSDFISNFMTSFQHYCRSCTPCPTILACWTQDHPKWRDWEKWLTSEGCQSVFADFHLGYTRTASSTIDTPQDTHVTRLTPTEHRTIISTRARLPGPAHLTATEALDFNVNNFGSPRLADAINDLEKPYHREYAVISKKTLSYLAVVTFYPRFDSPNRIIDSAWLIPLDKDITPDPADWRDITNAVRLFGYDVGIDIPSIRRMSLKSSPIQGEDAILRTFIMHPSGLSFFEGAK